MVNLLNGWVLQASFEGRCSAPPLFLALLFPEFHFRILQHKENQRFDIKKRAFLCELFLSQWMTVSYKHFLPDYNFTPFLFPLFTLILGVILGSPPPKNTPFTPIFGLFDPPSCTLTRLRTMVLFRHTPVNGNTELWIHGNTELWIHGFMFSQ